MFTVQTKISEKVVEAVIVGALEGGSNYWYYLSDDAVKTIRDYTPLMKGEPLSMRFVQALKEGAEIDINDIEDPDEILGTISTKTMGERTEKLINDGYGERLERVKLEQEDAWDADVIFQYWVLNEIVFG